jgi:hypothetical protein
VRWGRQPDRHVRRFRERVRRAPQVDRQRAAASVCCHGQQRVVFDARRRRTSTANNIPQPTLTATESTLGGSCAVFPGY